MMTTMQINQFQAANQTQQQQQQPQPQIHSPNQIHFNQ